MKKHLFYRNEYEMKHIPAKAGTVFLLAAVLFCFSACGSSESDEEFQVYYINEDKTGMEARDYDLSGETTEDQIEEIIDVLSEDTNSAKYYSPIPEDVSIQSYEYSGTYLTLTFSDSYSEVDNVTEILCRGAVARTFLQLSDINGIRFYVGDEALTDAEGSEVGLMTEDSFIDNPGEEIQNIQETEITLYFASEDGKSLVKEVQEVYYSSNVSTEKLVLEHLMEGPQSDDALGTIPEGTQLINVSVMDGICLVNFDEGFLNYDFDISEEVVIYSIVDSLAELDTIDTVQISIDGDTSGVYREDFSLEKQYESDLSLVTQEQEDIQVVDDAEDSQSGGTGSE